MSRGKTDLSRLGGCFKSFKFYIAASFVNVKTKTRSFIKDFYSSICSLQLTFHETEGKRS